MDNQLPLFEGRQVTKSAVKVTNAGDGLSEALKLEPEALSMDQEVCLVIRGTITQINHKSIDDVLTRVHTLKCSDAVKVKINVADQMIQAEKERLSALRDELDGQTRI